MTDEIINMVSEESGAPGPDIMALASEVVAAYVSNNPVPLADLPALIGNVYAALAGLNGASAIPSALVDEVQKPTPAQIRKSVRDDGIVSFLDGKTYQTLKRHLSGRGLDPQAYRFRFGLPANYPLVAPGYAAKRSAMAKALGLGVRPARETAGAGS